MRHRGPEHDEPRAPRSTLLRTGDGFLLCGHGSRDPASIAGFEAIAAGLAPLLPPGPFAHGFMELAEPDLDTAVGRLVAAGASRVLAVPGFLFAARHMREDLPRLLQAAGAHHGVDVTLGRELGADPRLVEALGDRLSSRHPRLRGDDGERGALILVGAGSSIEETNAGLVALADELGRIHRLPAIACFASVARPSVADAVATLVDRGHRRLVLLPWFLTEGSLLALARAQARTVVGDRGELVEAAALGAHPLVLATLAARAEELAREVALPSTHPSA